MSTAFTLDETWKQTLSRGVLRSRHFFVALCFNFLAYSNLAALAIRFHGDVRFQPYLDYFVLLLAFLGLYGGYYMLAVYREVHSQGDSVTEPMLRLSYFAFRVYLVGLFTTFVCFAGFLGVESR
jgi:hypothetical protein